MSYTSLLFSKTPAEVSARGKRVRQARLGAGGAYVYMHIHSGASRCVRSTSFPAKLVSMCSSFLPMRSQTSSTLISSSMPWLATIGWRLGGEPNPAGRRRRARAEPVQAQARPSPSAGCCDAARAGLIWARWECKSFKRG